MLVYIVRIFYSKHIISETSQSCLAEILSLFIHYVYLSWYSVSWESQFFPESKASHWDYTDLDIPDVICWKAR